jgi:L-amino acid N-acyltransferase YncA
MAKRPRRLGGGALRPEGHGLGKAPMNKLIACCRSHGRREIVGEALPQNNRVIRLVRGVGCEGAPAPEENTVNSPLPLD